MRSIIIGQRLRDRPNSFRLVDYIAVHAGSHK